MSAFLVALGLAALFVAGSVFAMQPSPRQRQLAALRQAAAVAGLRVRLRPGQAGAEYVLGWRTCDLAGARATDFDAIREGGAGWCLLRCSAGREPAVREALESLPESVQRLSGGADGLVAYWSERGAIDDVRTIAASLVALRAACGGD